MRRLKDVLNKAVDRKYLSLGVHKREMKGTQHKFQFHYKALPLPPSLVKRMEKGAAAAATSATDSSTTTTTPKTT
jgi:hypothetical protein